AAYENLAEATTDSDSDVKESLEIKDEKSGLIRKWERSKHFCTGSKAIVQNLFELPRQQEEVRSKVTEIIKFKASQKLLNPNVNEKNVIQDQKALFKAFDK
uniref:Uncharacterized protein n=1 Tax=Panagrolaimus sp. ES5 TaxID=591445 RepID=A0AC34FFF3_9BILA